jgi:hypothetical protein
MKILLFCLLFATPAFSADPWLLTSFRSNGETGVFASLSTDGRKWTPIQNDQPWIKPQHEGLEGVHEIGALLRPRLQFHRFHHRS